MALPAAARLRATLLGIALGVLSLVPVIVAGLLIVTGPFHTPIGGLA